MKPVSFHRTVAPATFASLMATQVAAQPPVSFDILCREPFGGFPATMF